MIFIKIPYEKQQLFHSSGGGVCSVYRLVSSNYEIRCKSLGESMILHAYNPTGGRGGVRDGYGRVSGSYKNPTIPVGKSMILEGHCSTGGRGTVRSIYG